MPTTESDYVDEPAMTHQRLEEENAQLRSALIQVRECIMWNIDLCNDDKHSRCMECGAQGEADKPDTIQHRYDCTIGNTLGVIDGVLEPETKEEPKP